MARILLDSPGVEMRGAPRKRGPEARSRRRFCSCLWISIQAHLLALIVLWLAGSGTPSGRPPEPAPSRRIEVTYIRLPAAERASRPAPSTDEHSDTRPVEQRRIGREVTRARPAEERQREPRAGSRTEEPEPELEPDSPESRAAPVPGPRIEDPEREELDRPGPAEESDWDRQVRSFRKTGRDLEATARRYAIRDREERWPDSSDLWSGPRGEAREQRRYDSGEPEMVAANSSGSYIQYADGSVTTRCAELARPVEGVRIDDSIQVDRLGRIRSLSGLVYGSVPTPLDKNEIELLEERLLMQSRAARGYWEVRGELLARNTSDRPLEVRMGFPFSRHGTMMVDPGERRTGSPPEPGLVPLIVEGYRWEPRLEGYRVEVGGGIAFLGRKSWEPERRAGEPERKKRVYYEFPLRFGPGQTQRISYRYRLVAPLLLANRLHDAGCIIVNGREWHTGKVGRTRIAVRLEPGLELDPERDDPQPAGYRTSYGRAGTELAWEFEGSPPEGDLLLHLRKRPRQIDVGQRAAR
ncbi:MAG: hypothetical protein JXR96_14295 [Deltaproteobacteria bacterium]|nr:hypothetical protein [Deltaproteobacteria bacterium]